MDEPNDMVDTAHFFIFIVMCFHDFSNQKKFLKVLSLTVRTRGEDIYKKFEQFIED